MDWNELDNTDVLADGRINDIAVAGAKRWAVSSDGRVFHWQAGGPVQATALDGAQHARAVAFENTGQIGWIGLLRMPVDDRPRLLKTTNGGESWDDVQELPAHPAEGVCGISVVHPELAFACGTFNNAVSPGVWRTRGGIVWEPLELPKCVSGLTDIEFWNENDGILIGKKTVKRANGEDFTSPTILLTDDGGTRWHEAAIEKEFKDKAHCWKVHRCDNEVAYVSIASSGEEGFVLKSTDGGKSWKALPVTDETAEIVAWELQGIGFSDRDTGWVGQHSGSVFETTDGGTSWHPANALLRHVNRLAFTAEGIYATGEAVYLSHRAATQSQAL